MMYLMLRWTQSALHRRAGPTAVALAGAILCSACVGPYRDSTDTWFIDASDYPPGLCDSQPSDDESLKCDRTEKDTVAGDLNNDGNIDFIVARKRYLSCTDCGEACYLCDAPGADCSSFAPRNHDPQACSADYSNFDSVVNRRSARLIMNDGGTLDDRTATLTPWANTVDHMTSRDVALADFNMDGFLDVVFAPTADEGARVYMNQGGAGPAWRGISSTAIFPEAFLTEQELYCAVAVGDVDGDGDADIYLSNYTGSGVTRDVLLMNRFVETGSVAFEDESLARLGDKRNSAFGTASRIIDIDGDGDQDIVKTSTLNSVSPWNAKTIAVLFNNGVGNFALEPHRQFADRAQYMFDIGYYNEDDCLDVYQVTDGTDYLSLGRMSNEGMVFDTTIELTRPELAALVGTSARNGGLGGNIKHITREGRYLTNSVTACTTTDIGESARLVDPDKIVSIVGIAPIDVQFEVTSCVRDSEVRPAGDMVLFRNLTDSAQWRDAIGTGEALLPGVNSSGGTPVDANNRQVWQDTAHDFEFADINNDGRVDIFMGLCTGYKVLQGVPLRF